MPDPSLSAAIREAYPIHVGVWIKADGGGIRDLRSLLGALRLAKRTAWQTIVKIVTTAFVLALHAWAGIKLKLMGDW